MKNLYIVAFLFLTGNFYSQNLQNANWIFGDNSWLDFNNAGVTAQPFLPVIPAFNREGVASVSDEEGNIIFWTDGEQVWRWDALSNAAVNYINGVGLFGDISSCQNVVIIPRPNHPGIFYLATITGYTSIQPGDVRGLYFSEVNTLTNTVSPTIRNIPLRDQFGVLIDNNYGNISEGITVTTGNNGNYWLVTHIQGENNNYSRIHSYEVTENGISLTPNYEEFFNNTVEDPTLVIKVSPDRTRIALSRDGVNPILGTFNDGVITMNPNPIGNTAFGDMACYGVEFSPNSQNLYFTRQGTGIVGVVLNNAAEEILIDNLDPAHAIQRAINDRLYIARKGSPFVSEIQNPNNLINATTIGYNQQVPLAGRTSSIGLPQWVWLNCEDTIVLTSPNDDVTNLSSLFVRHIEREQWIQASNVVGFGDNTFQNGVVYHAGRFIDLQPGFQAINGAQFAAYIEGCTNPNSFVYKNQSSDENSPNVTHTISKGLSIIPNPSNSFIEIGIYNEQFKKVIITSVEGKKVFEKDIEFNNSYNVDISDYSNGIYIVTIFSKSGQQFSQKLIKN
jgi:hypothetical protein